MKKLVTIPHARHSRELINFLSVLDHAVPDTSRVPVPFATITDRNFGVNDVVYSPADGLVITACEDADLISRLDSQLSNIPLPWEAKSKASSVVPLGSLNCWQLDTESGSYLPVSTLFYEHQVCALSTLIASSNIFHTTSHRCHKYLQSSYLNFYFLAS